MANHDCTLSASKTIGLCDELIGGLMQEQRLITDQRLRMINPHAAEMGHQQQSLGYGRPEPGRGDILEPFVEAQ